MASKEEIWRKQLLEDDVPPPASVWKGIEAELDRSRRRRFLVWFRLSGGIAAVLTVIGLGVWQPWRTANPDVAGVSGSPSERQTQISDVLKSAKLNQPKKVLAVENLPNPIVVSGNTSNQGHRKSRLFLSNPNFEVLTPFVALVDESKHVKGQDSAPQVALVRLANPAFRWYGNRFQWDRPRLPVPDVEDMPPSKGKQIGSNRYLAFQSNIAPFQPSVQWPGLVQEAFAAVRETLQEEGPLFSTSGNRTPLPVEEVNDMGLASVYDPSMLQPEQTFETGWAMQWSANTGWFFNEHWGVEVGLRYVQGAHTARSNVFSWNTQTSETQTFFEAMILQANTRNASIIASQETLQSRYQLISLPVQAVYRLPVAESWEVAATGGIALDKLMVNRWTWETQSAEQNYRPAESSYRPLSVSALGGIRVGKALTSQWLVSAGIFTQYSLNSWLSSEQVSMRPQQWGGQLGLTYRWP